MDIKTYIKDYLLVNDGIIIPGFGGFISEHESAVFDLNENVFLPPSKKLVFKPDFSYKDDSFAEFIAQNEAIELKDAIEKLDAFVVNLKTQLKNKKSVTIEDVGTFTLSKKDEVLFEQDKKTNFLADSFGLNSVKTTRIADKKELSIKNKTPKSKKSLKKPLVFAGSFIILAALLILAWDFTTGFTDLSFFSGNLQTETLQTTETTTKSVEYLDSIARADSIKANINKTIDVTTGKKEALFYTDQKKDSETSTPEFSKFYIIAGSFQSLNKAEIFCKELNKKGYSTEIIHSDNNLFRISIASYSSEGVALKELYKLRTNPEIKQVWILKSN
ncbi:MAG: SPOR domain-containing protein [Bacteroidales bacterium]